MYPPVSAFDRHMMSGATAACSHANIRPVRPKPVSTSSAIISVPNRSQSVLTPARNSRGQTIIPPAPCSIGSTITAATDSPCSASSAPREPRRRLLGSEPASVPTQS